MASSMLRVAADADGVERAVSLLDAGEIVVVPTETVYGLAADAASDRAVAKVFAAKGRPAINPLISHVSDPAMAERYGVFGEAARRLAAHFWPGPLTLVVPRRAGAALAGAVTAGLETVALRVPAHEVMQAVIGGLGRAVAAPSANVSGRLSPTKAEHVTGLEAALLLDAGPCERGLESTILKVAEDGALVLLRPGAVPVEAVAAVAGVAPALAERGAVEAPGMLLRHYAPRLPLLLEVRERRAGMVLIGFGGVEGDINLSPSGDLGEAAARLFDALHRADASGAEMIGVAPIPERGLGVAINDRLRRSQATLSG